MRGRSGITIARMIRWGVASQERMLLLVLDRKTSKRRPLSVLRLAEG
jgi:hypothetical protein